MQVRVLTTILFFYAFAYGITLPLAPILFLSSHGYLFSSATALTTKLFYLGIAYTIHPICMFLGTSYLGNLSDILNRKKTFMIAAGGLFLIYLATSAAIVSHSLIGYLLFRALSGLFRGTKPVVMAAIVDTSSPDTRVNSLRKADIGYILGYALGPFVGGYLATFSPALSYGFAALISLLSICAIRCFFTDTIAKTDIRPFSWNETLLSFAEGIKHIKTRYLIPQITLYEFSSVIYYITLVILMRNSFHYTSTQMGIVIGAQGIVYLITSLTLLRFLAKRFPAIAVSQISLGCLSFLLLIQSLFPTESGFLTLFVPIHLLCQMCNTLMYSNASEAAGSNYQGWAMGLVSGSVALAWIFGGSQSVLIETIGSKPMLQIAALASGLSLLCLHLHKRTLTSSARTS